MGRASAAGLSAALQCVWIDNRLAGRPRSEMSGAQAQSVADHAD